MRKYLWIVFSTGIFLTASCRWDTDSLLGKSESTNEDEVLESSETNSEPNDWFREECYQMKMVRTNEVHKPDCETPMDLDRIIENITQPEKDKIVITLRHLHSDEKPMVSWIQFKGGDPAHTKYLDFKCTAEPVPNPSPHYSDIQYVCTANDSQNDFYILHGIEVVNPSCGSVGEFYSTRTADSCDASFSSFPYRSFVVWINRISVPQMTGF